MAGMVLSFSLILGLFLMQIYSTVEAWAEVKTTTVVNCFNKCFGEKQTEIEPVPAEQIPDDFSREVWESQIDLEVNKSFCNRTY